MCFFVCITSAHKHTHTCTHWERVREREQSIQYKTHNIFICYGTIESPLCTLAHVIHLYYRISVITILTLNPPRSPYFILYICNFYLLSPPPHGVQVEVVYRCMCIFHLCRSKNKCMWKMSNWWWRRWRRYINIDRIYNIIRMKIYFELKFNHLICHCPCLPLQSFLCHFSDLSIG